MHDSIFGDISFSSSPSAGKKEFAFDFLCSTTEGARLKTFKLFLGKAEPLTEISLDLEEIEAKEKK